MKTLLKSLKLKYLVNVLLIVAFGITAQTGLFDGGGEHGGRSGEHGGGRHSREESSLYEHDINSMNEAEIVNLMSNESINPGPGGEKENTHVYLGLFFIVLMLVHITQHWSWFKRLFSINHIKNNKLLWVTAAIFIVMAISGIMLWTEAIPRGFINFKEIHEVTGQLLLGLVLIHIVQRFKWYISSTEKLFKPKTASVQA
jgi:cytochrome b561